MLEYLEDLWTRLPDALEPVDFDARRAFLLRSLGGAGAVLDLGCGQGEFTSALADAGVTVTGAEVSARAVERARGRHPALEFVQVPIDDALPFADGSFDAVWAGEVIEHVPDTARWLSEVRRVLRPGGRLVLTTPSHGRLRLLIGGIERFSEPLGDHLHLYTSRSLRELLRGFDFAELDVHQAAGPPGLRRQLLATAVRR